MNLYTKEPDSLDFDEIKLLQRKAKVFDWLVEHDGFREFAQQLKLKNKKFTISHWGGIFDNYTRKFKSAEDVVEYVMTLKKQNE